MAINGSMLLLEGLTFASSDAVFSTFIIVLFIYIFVLVSNLSISLLILLNHSLHKPMYLLYLNLSVKDLLETTTVIPLVLANLLRTPSFRVVHLYGCVIQAFLVHLCSSTGHTILMIMAFDRYVAICDPLQYSALMSGRTMVRLMVWAWGVAFLFVAVMFGLMLRLTRCRTLLSGLYCSNSSLFKLSCESTVINNIYGLFFTVVLFTSSMGSMVLTYSKIMLVCLKKKNSSLNRRALQTCSTHLLSYLVFFFDGMLIIMFHRFPSLTQERKLITIVYHLLPSGLNPLIYGLQSTEIRRSLGLVFRGKFSNGKK